MDLGGETLPEIALSIMAEITRLRRAAPEQVREPVKASKARSLPVMARSAETESSIESRDPICGMSVDTTNARYKSVHEEKTFYFCCLRCKETFDRSPHLYLETTVPGEL
jgi:YHS domain-containing protein